VVASLSRTLRSYASAMIVLVAAGVRSVSLPMSAPFGFVRAFSSLVLT
jgi:hypothetical protein